MTKIQRNDPCPCGSGKKYKRCCLSKDLEKERQKLLPQNSETDEKTQKKADVPQKLDLESVIQDFIEDESKNDSFEDSDRKEIKKFWNDFDTRDYDGKIAAFIEKLDDKEWMNDDAAFDMLDRIYQETIRNRNFAKFSELFITFEKKLPKIYKKSCHFYLKWQIQAAIVEQNWETVSVLVMKMTKIAYEHIDEFDAVVDELTYYGQLPLLVKATRAAWPKVKESAHIIQWGIDQFAEKAAHYLIFDHLETHSLDVDVDALFQQICDYSDFKSEWLPKYISHITGKADRKWTLEDFNLSTPSKKQKQKKKSKPRQDNKKEDTPDDKADAPDGKANLYYLSVEFLGYLRRERNVSYPKGEVARENIQKYLVERHTGKLEHQESMFEAMVRRTEGKRKPKKKQREIENILCPDCETLDRYITRFFGFFGQRPHDAATMFELLPEWLTFLESHNLLDQQLRQQTLSSMQELKETLLGIFRKEPDGSILEKQIEESWG